MSPLFQMGLRRLGTESSHDSSLEGDGFEPSVPRHGELMKFALTPCRREDGLHDSPLEGDGFEPSVPLSRCRSHVFEPSAQYWSRSAPVACPISSVEPVRAKKLGLKDTTYAGIPTSAARSLPGEVVKAAAVVRCRFILRTLVGELFHSGFAVGAQRISAHAVCWGFGPEFLLGSGLELGRTD